MTYKSILLNKENLEIAEELMEAYSQKNLNELISNTFLLAFLFIYIRNYEGKIEATLREKNYNLFNPEEAKLLYEDLQIIEQEEIAEEV